MTTTESLVFEPWHLDAAEFDPFHTEQIDTEFTKQLASNSPAVTLTVDGVIVAFIGYFKISQDMIHVYVLPTIHLPKYRFSVVKRLRTVLKNLSEQYTRVQTISYSDGRDDKWMRVLGFDCECVQFKSGQLEYKVWSQVRT